MVVGMTLATEADGHLDGRPGPEIVQAVGQEAQALEVALVKTIKIAAPDEFGRQAGAHDRPGADQAEPALGPGREIGDHLFGGLALRAGHGFVHRGHGHPVLQFHRPDING